MSPADLSLEEESEESPIEGLLPFERICPVCHLAFNYYLSKCSNCEAIS